MTIEPKGTQSAPIQRMLFAQDVTVGQGHTWELVAFEPNLLSVSCATGLNVTRQTTCGGAPLVAHKSACTLAVGGMLLGYMRGRSARPCQLACWRVLATAIVALAPKSGNAATS
jgi:hypothetical protein